MTRTLRIVAISALGIALTGCVSQEKYNAHKLENASLVEQLANAQRDASAQRAEAEA